MEMAKRKEKERKRQGGDCNFPYIISRILNFDLVVCFLERCGTCIHG